QLAFRNNMCAAADPGDGAPTVPVSRVHLAKGCCYDLDLWMPLDNTIDHSEKRAGIELGFRGDLRTPHTQPFLKVFLVADQDIDVFDDASDDFNGALGSAGAAPELLAEVQVERNHSPGSLRRTHALDDQFGC